jgi:hypothetical protein
MEPGIQNQDVKSFGGESSTSAVLLDDERSGLEKS